VSRLLAAMYSFAAAAVVNDFKVETMKEIGIVETGVRKSFSAVGAIFS